MAKTARKGDVVIATGHTFAECDYYMKLWQIPVTVYSYPLSTMDHPGYFTPADDAMDPERLEKNAKFITADATASFHPDNRIIVLLTPHSINAQLLQKLSKRYTIVGLSQDYFRQSILALQVKILWCKRTLKQEKSDNAN